MAGAISRPGAISLEKRHSNGFRRYGAQPIPRRTLHSVDFAVGPLANRKNRDGKRRTFFGGAVGSTSFVPILSRGRIGKTGIVSKRREVPNDSTSKPGTNADSVRNLILELSGRGTLPISSSG